MAPAAAERCSLDYGGVLLHYTLRLSERRSTICIQVLPGGELRVAAPASAQRTEINDFMRANWQWIQSKQRALREYSPLPRFPLEDGARLPLLDGTLILRQHLAEGTRPEVVRRDEELVIRAPAAALVPELVVAWYRSAARHHVSKRIDHFAGLVGRTPSRLTIRGQKTRWGSCSALGTVSINWRLMQASAEIIDYVIVHELCHLLHRDHSTRFWREVGRIMPNYQQLRRDLRAFGLSLAF